ncbi:MAG: hypothetical protein ACTSO9_20020 [Candidatus Helarchaeota archaeon]
MEKSEIISLITLICSATALAIMIVGFMIVLGMKTNVDHSILGTLVWMYEYGFF